MKDDELVMAVARGIVASDFPNQRLGELTEDRWQEMLKHWRELENEPLLRSGHRLEDAMRRARATIAAINASGTHKVVRLMVRMIPPHQRQTCKACSRPDKFDFHVPDEVWAAVVPPELVNRVVCLFCFDEFARQNGTAYANHLSEVCFAGDRASFTFRVERAVDVA